MPIITISRQAGSFGDEVARALSSKLGWELIDHDKVLQMFMSDVANSYELSTLSESAKFYLKENKNRTTFLQHMRESVVKYSEGKNLILVGFGSQAMFADDDRAVLVRIAAPMEIRIEKLKKQYHINDHEANEILSISDKKQKRFISTLFNADVSDPSLYNITLNTAMLSVHECVVIILSILEQRELNYKHQKEIENKNIIDNTEELPVLKNPSEIEFARILDMYRIDWKYEPKTFPIEWDAEGKVTLAFSPDFYLTKFNTYIELTVMNQKYINKKMKKLKRLRELYPDINIKLVNKKNFSSLLERFQY